MGLAIFCFCAALAGACEKRDKAGPPGYGFPQKLKIKAITYYTENLH